MDPLSGRVDVPLRERAVRFNELRAIETFTKAVELGSLRRAAAAQGVTPQAASQAVAQLEHHLGARLLHRTTRSLSLTDEGQQLLEATRPALAALDRALERVRAARDEIAGPVRIVGPRSSFAAVLSPVLDEYCRQHPEVQPDVQLDDGIGNWVLDRVDVGFRIGISPEEGLIARPLFPIQLIICAAPAYLERHGTPRSLDELTSHRCGVFRHPATGKVLPWHLNMDGEIVHRFFPPTLATNDTELELQAALDGQVVAQVSAMYAAPLFRAGRLVPLLTQHITEHLRLYLYYGSRKAQPSRARRFIDLAVKRLADNPQFVLSARELAAAEPRGKRVRRASRTKSADSSLSAPPTRGASTRLKPGA
jgi:DNA-binding transcriptional LysR family regulator